MGSIKEYLTQLKESDKEINEDNDQWETAGEKFGKEEPETARGETITDILDRCARGAHQFYRSLAMARKFGIKLPGAKETNKFNPLFVGPTGAGKTSIVSAWAEDNGYELVTLNMMGDALDFLGVKTIDREHEVEIDDEGHTKKMARVSTVATQAFDKFLHGTTKILFLDEINKTNPRILQSLYDLISFHTVQNGDEVMFLPKLLFVVGAMNPSEYGSGREELDPALKARMQVYPVNYDTVGLAEYLRKTLSGLAESNKQAVEKIEKGEEDPEIDVDESKEAYFEYSGMLDIVNELFKDPSKFRWTDAKSISKAKELDPILVPRTLEMALYACDGTKASFLKSVKKCCGIDALSMINGILSGYKDKDHIANKIWGKDYTPTEEQPTNSAENDILNDASEEERAGAAPEQSLYRKLQDRRRGR